MLKQPWNRLTRRSFLSRVSIMAAGWKLLPFISGHFAYAEKHSEVGLIKTGDRKDAVRRAFKLGSPPDMQGKKVLIKPNFNTADPAPGSTHNDTLSTMIDEIRERGAREIIIGERSGPPDTREVMEDKGIFELAEEKNVRVVNFDELEDHELVHFEDEQMHWKEGFHVPRILYEADHILACGCLKTHQHNGVFTMALKLAVGIIPREGTDYMRQLHDSDAMRKMIAEINLAYRPDMYIIDGVDAFVSGGPATGEKVRAGVTLCSRDPVAIDAVGVGILKKLGSTPDIMDKPVFEQEQIARAVEIGLGVSSPDMIRMLSDDLSGEDYIRDLDEHLKA